MNSYIFYILSFFIILCALFTVSSRRIFRSAIFLMISLIGISGLYFLMEYSFLAVVQLVVYAGGIVVLILFAILLTHEIGFSLPGAGLLRRGLTGVMAVCGFFLTVSILTAHPFPSGKTEMNDPAIAEIGRQLMNIYPFGYILPFEVISILLLVALVGCVVIAMKNK